MGRFVRSSRDLTRWALLTPVALVLAAGCALTPRADRDWEPYLARTTHVEPAGAHEEVVLSSVTDWRYDAAGPTEQCARSVSIDPAELTAVWFVLEPLPGSRRVAHTFLLFELEGDRMIGLTIEARRERDETYSALRGLFNAYELSYLWGTARDLLTRRAVMLDHQVLIYPLALDGPQRRGLLHRLMVRTQELETRPRFYNTLRSNCTNELAKAAGLPWNRAFVLTGFADDYLFEHGLIPGDDFAQVQARADMTQAIKAANALDDGAEFDSAILSELRARLAEAKEEEGAEDDGERRKGE